MGSVAPDNQSRAAGGMENSVNQDKIPCCPAIRLLAVLLP